MRNSVTPTSYGMKYFDKTFWKMFSGFVAILAISLVIIFGVRIYEQNQIKLDQDNLALPSK